jgi:hypothetical protein
VLAANKARPSASTRKAARAAPKPALGAFDAAAAAAAPSAYQAGAAAKSGSGGRGGSADHQSATSEVEAAAAALVSQPSPHSDDEAEEEEAEAAAAASDMAAAEAEADAAESDGEGDEVTPAVLLPWALDDPAEAVEAAVAKGLAALASEDLDLTFDAAPLSEAWRPFTMRVDELARGRGGAFTEAQVDKLASAEIGTLLQVGGGLGGLHARTRPFVTWRLMLWALLHYERSPHYTPPCLTHTYPPNPPAPGPAVRAAPGARVRPHHRPAAGRAAAGRGGGARPQGRRGGEGL